MKETTQTRKAEAVRAAVEIRAEKRALGQKNAANKSIAENKLIGIIYDKDENVPISLNRHDFEKTFAHLQPNDIVYVKIGAKKYKTFVKNCDYFERNARLRHVDFYHVGDKAEITLRVPFQIEGLAAGVKKGGVIKKFVDTIQVKSKTDAIPANICVEVDSLETDESLSVADVPVSENYSILDPSTKRIVAVVATRTSTKDDDDVPAAKTDSSSTNDEAKDETKASNAKEVKGGTEK